MITYVFKSLGRRQEHVVLVILGLLVVGSGLALFVSASQTSTQLVTEELQRCWRTSYDLLVRPPGAATATEQEYGLVRANTWAGSTAIFLPSNMRRSETFPTSRWPPPSLWWAI